MVKQASISLDPSTVEQIAAIRAQVRETLGTTLTVSRVVNAAVAQYDQRLQDAGALHGES